MKTRKFGATGLHVGEIGFGAWAIGGAAHLGYGPTDDSTSIAAIKKALECGVTFFDTADIYGHGHSEELLGRTLKGRRQQIILASKVGYDFYGGPVRHNFTPEHIHRALEKSLTRLKTDTIDVYQLHNPAVHDLEALDVLRKFKEQGKVRAIGVSISTPEEATAAVKAGAESVQLVLNYLQHEHTLDLGNAAIIAREPLARGLLTGKFTKDSTFPENDARSKWKNKWASYIDRIEEFKRSLQGVSCTVAALQWVLNHPQVSCTIPGAKTPQQVAENCSASYGR